MSGIQILIGRRPHSAPSQRVAPLHGVLDMLVDGRNITARMGEGQVLPLLRDLALCTMDILSGRRMRQSVRFYQDRDVWELGLLRDGADILLSVFRSSPSPEVILHEWRMEGAALLDSIASALEEALKEPLGPTPEPIRTDLCHAHTKLIASRNWSQTIPAEGAFLVLPTLSQVHVGARQRGPLSFACDLWVRSWNMQTPKAATASVQRSDLLSLLSRGQLHLRMHEHSYELGEAFVFLIAERLIEITAEMIDAAQRGSAFYRRTEVDGIRFELRLVFDPKHIASGSVSFAVQGNLSGAKAATEASCVLDPSSFANELVSFGQSLSRALVRYDRSHLQNLRYHSFRTSVKALRDQSRLGGPYQDRVNDAPEGYRAYALATQRPIQQPPSSVQPGRLRFTPLWEASVPGLDLRATFLCGDRLMVGTSYETACVDRLTGDVLWKRPTVRAACVPTPGGLARVHSDGQLHIHDYGTGEVTLAIRIAPQAASQLNGAVVHAPGLPKFLVITEGERSLSAIDLISGQIQWRHTLSRTGVCRVRRAGKLLLACFGAPYLTALDVQSGEVVWRLCDQFVFTRPPTLDHNDLFALAEYRVGKSNKVGKIRLFCLDAWSGTVRFSAALPSGKNVVGSPLCTPTTVLVVVSNEHGLGLVALDRTTGETLYVLEPGLAPMATAWMTLDNTLLGNTEDGIFFSLDAASGKVNFRFALSSQSGGSQSAGPSPSGGSAPRCLEPVLRNGALFVPQREVHVIRPRDGAELGKVPCDLIPDLLRVDEHCDVYIAEESGHLAAFGAGPKLTLVKGGAPHSLQ